MGQPLTKNCVENKENAKECLAKINQKYGDLFCQNCVDKCVDDFKKKYPSSNHLLAIVPHKDNENIPVAKAISQELKPFIDTSVIQVVDTTDIPVAPPLDILTAPLMNESPFSPFKIVGNKNQTTGKAAAGNNKTKTSDTAAAGNNKTKTSDTAAAGNNKKTATAAAAGNNKKTATAAAAGNNKTQISTTSNKNQTSTTAAAGNNKTKTSGTAAAGNDKNTTAAAGNLMEAIRRRGSKLKVKECLAESKGERPWWNQDKQKCEACPTGEFFDQMLQECHPRCDDIDRRWWNPKTASCFSCGQDMLWNEEKKTCQYCYEQDLDNNNFPNSPWFNPVEKKCSPCPSKMNWDPRQRKCFEEKKQMLPTPNNFQDELKRRLAANRKFVEENWET